MSGRALALWAAAGTGFQVGASMVATRYVVDAAGPASLGFLRYGIGFLCLVPVLLLQLRMPINRRDTLPIGLLGIGQFRTLIVLLNFSLLHIPSARASLLFATFPLMTMLLSVGLAALFRDRMGAIVFIGVSSGIGFFLWVYALGRAPPMLVTMFLGLSPITATLGGTLLLSEPLPVSALVGLACVISGLLLALRASK